MFNNLVKSKILSKNQLFSTLDTTTRKIYLDQNVTATMSDTVGFINKLPTILVESFKSTLEEAINADVLLHVIDYANYDFEEKIETVDSILNDLGLSDVPKILIKNKIDIKENEITKLYLNESYIEQITTSAKEGTGLLDLREQLLSLSYLLLNKKQKIYIPSQ